MEITTHQGERESRSQGEGGQVVTIERLDGTQDARRRDNTQHHIYARLLESLVTRKLSSGVRRGAIGKVPQGNSLVAYPTSRPVRRWGRLEKGPRLERVERATSPAAYPTILIGAGALLAHGPTAWPIATLESAAR